MQKSFKDILGFYKQQPRNQIHSFHRYFGKLIPGIPAFAIETFTKPGDTVLDPFCGSGTSIVEARERGRKSIGVDLNPLAIFMAEIKTTPIATDKLQTGLSDLLSNFTFSEINPTAEEPYVVNIDHWFRPEVKKELLRLHESINRLQPMEVKNFYLGVFSAFLRGVSNADPRHVFPGYSKRMRALDEVGRLIDVESSFVRASKKRIVQVSRLEPKLTEVKLHTGTLANTKIRKNEVDLVVTNPPYISSIRYLETMKIEMGWMGFLNSKDEYLNLDKKIIGTERFYKEDLKSIETTGYEEIDIQISRLKEVNPKMAKTVSKYFIDMDQVFSRLSEVIKPSGHMVIKISDSKVRTDVIATHKHFINMCEKLGFTLLEDLIDEFDPNSRSLLTARNSYSGIMTFDHLLIFKKTNA
jgi:DNA modification methylase